MSVCKGCNKIKKQVKELRERKRADRYVIVRSDCNDCGKDKQYGFWGLKEVKGWVHPNEGAVIDYSDWNNHKEMV